MDYARPIMWNVPDWAEVAIYLMIPLLIVAFLAGLVWRVRKWTLGRPEPGGSGLLGVVRQALGGLAPRRLPALVGGAIFQSRLLRDPLSLLTHQAIFWGMVVLFLGTALATIDQDFLNLPFDVQILRGLFYNLFKLALDLFGLLLIAGLGTAVFRRYVLRPRRFDKMRAGISLWDGFPLLASLLLIAVTGFLLGGLRVAEGLHIDARLAAAAASGSAAQARAVEELGRRERFHHLGPQRQEAELRRITAGGPLFPAAAWAPVGYGLGKLLAPLEPDTIRLLHRGVWWFHALLAFAFIAAIPFTKAFHILSSPLNILFRNDDPPGKLPVVVESGVRTLKDFTWRQLLQVEACTWCGKCQEECPGFNTGFPLSPRDVVQALDSRLLRTPARANGELASLHEAAVRPEELWSCCTCRACEDICPVYIQQPRLIIDLRRHLVDQGQVDEGLQDTLMNLQRYGNSFGQSARKRADWTKPLDFKLKDARKEEVEYLWFVGDYASYDQRAQEVTRTVAKVLHAAGQDVGLLLDKEQNAGNDARRIGEEGLFSLLREKNGKELAAAKFRALLTTDPHTYNTLKNEYDGGDGPQEPLSGKRVLHYTELLDELVAQGKLKFARSLGCTVTYHDPCYLGRFNGVYEPPRRVMRALGATLIEMPRNRRRSFCCGAGGGRIWMKDTLRIEERPAENRIREALALPGVQAIVVACPKDFVMFQDAVKTVGAESRLRVVDLGELVYEAMGISAEVVEHKA
jgi:Fe-S oxidoreductase